MGILLTLQTSHEKAGRYSKMTQGSFARLLVPRGGYLSRLALSVWALSRLALSTWLYLPGLKDLGLSTAVLD